MKQLLLLLLLIVPFQAYSQSTYINPLEDEDFLQRLQSYQKLAEDYNQIHLVLKEQQRQYNNYKTGRPIRDRYDDRKMPKESPLFIIVALILIIVVVIFIWEEHLIIPIVQHRKEVDQSLALLFKNHPSWQIRNCQEFNAIHDFDWHDPIIQTQHLAKRISNHYGLQVNTVSVSFDDTLEVGGKVELHPNHDFFVEIHKKYILNRHKITAILAHEIAHIYLSKKGLYFTETLENEILTDTTAVVMGFGYHLMQNYAEETYHTDNMIKTEKLGYIDVSAIAYILSLLDFHKETHHSPQELFQKSHLPFSECKSAIGRGYNAFHYGLKAVPHAKAALFRKLWFRLKSQKLSRLFIRKKHNAKGYTLTKSDSLKLTFNCPICKTHIRIPVLGKKLKVKCPQCEKTLHCLS